MIWESMQSVLPQCPDVHGQDVADVVDVEDAHHDRQEVPRQQYSQPSASIPTSNDAGRDIEAHHHLPLPISLAMERSLSLGGISWNDLCLYPNDDDDGLENHHHHHRQQRQHTDNDFIDNDECHLYAKDNPYNVRSDDDSFNDNLSPPSALSSCTTNKRRKIMLWTAIFGFMAAIAIALAIGMSVVANKHSQRDKEVGAQFTSSENNASLEDNNNNRDMPTTSKTYHPTYSPTMFEPT